MGSLMHAIGLAGLCDHGAIWQLEDHLRACIDSRDYGAARHVEAQLQQLKHQQERNALEVRGTAEAQQLERCAASGLQVLLVAVLTRHTRCAADCLQCRGSSNRLHAAPAAEGAMYTCHSMPQHKHVGTAVGANSCCTAVRI